MADWCLLGLQLAAHVLMLALVSADVPGFDVAQVTLKLCWRHVDKEFLVPQQHLQTPCFVYQILATNAIPHAVRCRQFKVGSHSLTEFFLPLCAEAVHLPKSQLQCR